MILAARGSGASALDDTVVGKEAAVADEQRVAAIGSDCAASELSFVAPMVEGRPSVAGDRGVRDVQFLLVLNATDASARRRIARHRGISDRQSSIARKPSAAAVSAVL